MKKFKFGVLALLGLALTFGATSCSDDDPNYDNVTPPTVEVANNTLSGVISGKDGKAIADATVTLGETSAKTDAEGIYRFDDVKAGTYAIKAEAEGKLPQEGTVTVETSNKTQCLVWNAILATEVKEEITASATEETKGSVESEHLEGNDNAKVEVEATVPPVETMEVPDDVPVEEVKIGVKPVYDAGDVVAARSTRAGEEAMLIGAELSCNVEGVKLTKPIDLSLDVETEVATNVVAKQYANGQWVEVPCNIVDGKVVIPATEFTTYGLFLGISFSASAGNEAISFTQSEWNNLYGNSEMAAGSATYTYKVGTEITSQGTSKLTALLIEKLAQRYGANVKNVQGSYPLNVTLPIGTSLVVSGIQGKENVSASAMGKTVSGTRYGTVTVTVTTANRSHTGGSN